MGNQEWTIKNGQSRMDNQEETIKNEQSRMNNQEWTIKNGQSRMNNQEWTIKNEQSRDIGNTENTRHRTTTNKTQKHIDEQIAIVYIVYSVYKTETFESLAISLL
jgi:hypothetical protein